MFKTITTTQQNITRLRNRRQQNLCLHFGA